MPIAGKKSKALASTDDQNYTEIQGLNEIQMQLEGDNQDITTFTAEFVKRLQGLKDNSFSLSGFYEPDDTDGQKAILNALLNDTPIFVKFLPDGVSGFKQEVKPASFEVNPSVDGTNEVSIDLDGTDEVTLV